MGVEWGLLLSKMNSGTLKKLIDKTFYRNGQDIAANAEVVQLTQMNIRADRARLEAGEQLLRLRLDDDQRQNQIKCLLFDGALPALLSWSMFVFSNGVERILPGPF